MPNAYVNIACTEHNDYTACILLALYDLAPRCSSLFLQAGICSEGHHSCLPLLL